MSSRYRKRMKHQHRLKKRFRTRPSQLTAETFQLAPFIDVIFVLLLYYILKIGMMHREGLLHAKLPGPDSEVPEALQLQEETVRVDEDGAFYHNEESVSPDELQQHMQQLHQQTSASRTPLLVTLSTEPDTRYSEIVKALNLMNKAGVESITFETLSEE